MPPATTRGGRRLDPQRDGRCAGDRERLRAGHDPGSGRAQRRDAGRRVLVVELGGRDRPRGKLHGHRRRERAGRRRREGARRRGGGDRRCHGRERLRCHARDLHLEPDRGGDDACADGLRRGREAQRGRRPGPEGAPARDDRRALEVADAVAAVGARVHARVVGHDRLGVADRLREPVEHDPGVLLEDLERLLRVVARRPGEAPVVGRLAGADAVVPERVDLRRDVLLHQLDADVRPAERGAPLPRGVRDRRRRAREERVRGAGGAAARDSRAGRSGGGSRRARRGGSRRPRPGPRSRGRRRRPPATSR